MITDRSDVQYLIIVLMYNTKSHSYLVGIIIWLALVWNTIYCSTVLIHKSYYVSLTNVFPLYKENIDQTLISRDTNNVLLFTQDFNTTSSEIDCRCVSTSALFHIMCNFQLMHNSAYTWRVPRAYLPTLFVSWWTTSQTTLVFRVELFHNSCQSTRSTSSFTEHNQANLKTCQPLDTTASTSRRYHRYRYFN